MRVKSKCLIGLVLLVLCGAIAFSANAYEVIEDFESPESASRIISTTKKQNGLTLEISDQFVTTGTKALHVKLPKWGPGIVEWPVVSIPLGRTVDFTAYDRILVEMYNNADGGDAIVWYACEEKGDIGPGKRFQTLLPTFTCDLWVTPLDKWPKTLNPKNISRLVFFLHPPQNLNLYIGRIVLLKKGEAIPEPSTAFIDTVLKPKVRDAFSEIKDSPFVTDPQRKTIADFLANPKVTVDDVDAFRRRVAKLKDCVGHLQSYETFRKSCGSQGLLVGEATTMEQVLPRDVNPPRKAERFCEDRLEWVLPELKRLKEQGRLGPVNVCYFFPDGGFDDAAYARWQEKGLPRVKKAYAFLKEHDLLDTVYVYGGDELNANAFPLMGKMVADVRKACPGLPIATTLHDDSYGSTSALDYDWFIRTSQDYEQFCGARIDGARARGRKAWWYLCDGPYPPFANFYLQSAAIEGRLLMNAAGDCRLPSA